MDELKKQQHLFGENNFKDGLYWARDNGKIVLYKGFVKDFKEENDEVVRAWVRAVRTFSYANQNEKN